jgi:hypothetical protein
MERDTGDHLITIPDHKIVPDILVNLAQGTGKHLTLPGEFVDELVHLRHIRHFGFFHLHLGLLPLF